MITGLANIFAQSGDLSIIPVTEGADKGKDVFEALKGLSLDDAISKIANGMVDFAFKLLIAVLVFYVGKFIIKKLYTLTRGIMMRHHMEASLTTFVLSLVRMVLFFILIVTVIGILGIETTSFLAIFASAGVAIGMALSGTLQNFAGGVLIMLLKPYKVGDFIETQGYTGTVKAIQIFHTVINTVDNKAIIVPNGGLSTGTINNYSLEKYRRVDWTITLSYGVDYEAASAFILEMLCKDARVLRTEEADSETEPCAKTEGVAESTVGKGWWKRIFGRGKASAGSYVEIDPVAGLPRMVGAPPFVGLGELAASSVNITVRAWTKAEDYWPLFFDMNKRFYKELPANGFNFPFPQLDVHFDTPTNIKS